MFRYLILLVAGLLMSGCGVEGLHTANPKTIVRVKPLQRQVELFNSKDTSVTLKKLTYDPETGLFVLEDLEITDEASSVRQANVEQINALAIQAAALGQAWSQGLAAGAQLAGQLSSAVGAIGGPPVWGAGQPGVRPPGWTTPTTRPCEVDVE